MTVLGLSGYKGWQDRKVAKASAVAFEQRIFHWFIEFPEVFDKGGFNCILGNPPYLGGTKISEQYGDTYFTTLKEYYQGFGGRTDLIVCFLQRFSKIVLSNGFIGFVTTNTISQAETRKAGLEILINNGFLINFTNPLLKWPGTANLEVSLIALTKTTDVKKYIIDKATSFISSFLKGEEHSNEPHVLFKSSEIYSSEGTKIYGDGFLVDESIINKLKNNDEDSLVVIKPYLSGDDLNTNFDFSHSRFVIDFTGMSLDEAKKYSYAFRLIEENVKPYRETINDKTAKNNFWLYQRDRKELYTKINHLEKVLVTAKTSKYINFNLIENKKRIFSNSVVVIASDSLTLATILQSSFHYYWVQKYSSTLESRLRYSPSNILVNFPIKEMDLNTNKICEFFAYRNQILLEKKIGLTKLFNMFNDISNNEYCIVKLRELYIHLDNEVLKYYGWENNTDGSQNKIRLNHDFYEMEFLPENDRVRFTIHPDARKEILKRLLELNHKIHAEEVAAGLWDKKTTVKTKKNKGTDPNQNKLL